MANREIVSTLKSSRDFLKLKEAGVNIGVTKWLSLSFLPNKANALRVGWTYPNYIGPAVVRNKLKRWSREFTQKKLSADIAVGAFDVNIFLRRRSEEFYKTLTHEVFDGALQHAFEKFSKFCPRSPEKPSSVAH